MSSGWPFDPSYSASTSTSTSTSPPASAAPTLDDHAFDLARAQRRSAANRSLIIGVILVVIGVVITAATYSAAASNRHGGTYIVAYGPIAVGILRILRGLFAR